MLTDHTLWNGVERTHTNRTGAHKGSAAASDDKRHELWSIRTRRQVLGQKGVSPGSLKGGVGPHIVGLCDESLVRGNSVNPCVERYHLRRGLTTDVIERARTASRESTHGRANERPPPRRNCTRGGRACLPGSPTGAATARRGHEQDTVGAAGADGTADGIAARSHGTEGQSTHLFFVRAFGDDLPGRH